VIPPTLPTTADLQSQLERLEANSGSVVIIAIEQPEVCNFTRCTWAWLSRTERQSLRAALEKARAKREAGACAPRGDLAACSEGDDSGQLMAKAKKESI
jgi:hypothetical protein